MYHAQKKHKAKHGGYLKRPSKKGVNALLNLYEEINNVLPKAGEQLKIDFK